MRPMLEHFDMLAPWYDRLMGPPDVERLADLLKLPSTGGCLTAAAAPDALRPPCGSGSAAWW